MSGANLTLCLFAYAKYLSCARSSRRQFSTAKGEIVSRFVLSINADPLISPDSNISSSSLENSRNRIGESGDPCGIPVFICTFWLVNPLVTRRVFYPLTKPLIT